MIEAYLREQDLFIDHSRPVAEKTYTDILELDLSTIVPSVAGPKRPHDRVAVSDLAKDFSTGLTKPVSFKGYGLKEDEVAKSVAFKFEDKDYTLTQGSVVLAAITSCTNTSNPSVMLGAGLLAKNAVERGLVTAPFIKTSLAPGSGVVTKYLEMSGLQPYLDKLGFSLVGYGCTYGHSALARLWCSARSPRRLATPLGVLALTLLFVCLLLLLCSCSLFSSLLSVPASATAARSPWR